MTFYPTLEGPAMEAYRGMVSALKAKARTELNLTDADIVLRDLRPADLGEDSSTPDYNVGLTVLTWTAIVSNVTIADNRFVGINGVYQYMSGTSGAGAVVPNVPTVEQIRITRKGSVARYWQVKPIADWEHKTGWVDDPIIVDQNTTITIEGLARNASSIAGKFDLIGAVVEKRGLLINP